MPWPITIFADEADPSFAEQAAFIRDEGLDGIDIRNANGRNCIELTPDDIQEIKDSGLKVQCIGSPVNKVPLDMELAGQELDKFKKAVEVAQALDCRRIRIFSPEPDRTEDKEQIWARIDTWLTPMVDHAINNDIRILHENDAWFYGAKPEETQRVMEHFDSLAIRAAFDFANTVKIGFKPYNDWFPWIVPYLDTIHIKDAIQETQTVVPAGEGEGQIKETLQYLKDQNWHGPLTLEPHLAADGKFGGFSGKQLCSEAHKALKTILNDLT